jgi:hypothetical protein
MDHKEVGANEAVLFEEKIDANRGHCRVTVKVELGGDGAIQVEFQGRDAPSCPTSSSIQPMSWQSARRWSKQPIWRVRQLGLKPGRQSDNVRHTRGMSWLSRPLACCLSGVRQDLPDIPK